MPVQPVCIRYTSSAVCDPSWVTGGPGPGEILLKLICQVRNPIDPKSPERSMQPAHLDHPQSHHNLITNNQQPYNSMEVIFLPVYTPSSEEQADAILYANNVRKQMADVLGVRPTSHTFEDVLLQCEVRFWMMILRSRKMSGR